MSSRTVITGPRSRRVPVAKVAAAILAGLAALVLIVAAAFFTLLWLLGGQW